MGKNSDRELHELRNLIHEIGRYRQPPDWALKECRRIYLEYERRHVQARDPVMGEILDEICFIKIDFFIDGKVNSKPMSDRRARRNAICKIKSISDDEIEESVDKQVARAWKKDIDSAKRSKFRSTCREDDMVDSTVNVFDHLGLPETKRVDRCIARHTRRRWKRNKE